MEEKQKLREIYSEYQKIHGRMNSIKQQLESLEIERRSLESKLLETRDIEKDLINKLETKLNTKIDQDYLFQIIFNNA